MAQIHDIEIENELRPNYAYVRCRGTLDADVMLEVYERALRFARNGGQKALLVDIRDLTGEPYTVTERFDAGVRVAEMQQGPGRGVAFALLGNVPMVDPNRFGETVGRNRGALVRVFTDCSEAVAWLERPD